MRWSWPGYPQQKNRTACGEAVRLYVTLRAG